jgi:NAD(P)H-quinone oxidoreductase subunit 5
MGFIKPTYFYLQRGNRAFETAKPTPIKIKPVQAVIVLFFGILGAFLFAYLTGKGTELNSSIFLTLIVAITVGQATYNIVKEQSLSLFKNHFATILFVCGMVTYALIYRSNDINE